MTKNSIKNIFEIKSIKIEPKTIDLIFTYFKKYIKSEYKILIALSGGSDSVLLSVLVYYFFIKNGLDTKNIYFIHLNHKTRNTNIQDEKFVKSFFKGTNLIIHKRENNLKTNENNLRKRRYEEINKEAKKNNIDLILFGHNLSDRIESTFMNLLRGSNIQGFKSMSLIQKHHLLEKSILRPLIGISKEEIKNICEKNKIAHIEDETNKDPNISLRNKIRIELLPSIYKLSNKNREYGNAFVKSMKSIYEELDKEKSKKENEKLLKDIIKSPYRNCKFGYEINIFKKLLTNDDLVSIIKKLGIYKNFNSKFLKELLDFLKNKDSGFKYFNQTYFFISHNKIYLIQAPENFWTKTIDKELIINKLGTHILGKISIKIDNKEMIGGTLRFPKAGDKFKNKTRNQFCSDQKIPVFRRNFIPIIEKNGKISKVFKDIYNT